MHYARILYRYDSTDQSTLIAYRPHRVIIGCHAEGLTFVPTILHGAINPHAACGTQSHTCMRIESQAEVPTAAYQMLMNMRTVQKPNCFSLSIMNERRAIHSSRNDLLSAAFRNVAASLSTFNEMNFFSDTF